MKTILLVPICAFAISVTGTVSTRGDDLRKQPSNAPFSRDVILSDDTLFGRYVNDAGVGIKDMRATIRQAGKEVASGMTDAQGNFRVSGLQTGVYEVIIGCRSEFIRVWDSEAAPPKAHPTAKIVRDGHLQGNGGPGGALRLMGAGCGALDLFGSLLGREVHIKDPPVTVPNVP